jgi:hypothetical protein
MGCLVSRLRIIQRFNDLAMLYSSPSWIWPFSDGCSPRKKPPAREEAYDAW